MNTPVLVFAVLICAETLFAADLPSSIPIGVNGVQAYEIGAIRRFGLNLFSSPNTPTRNWTVIGYYDGDYLATNGVIDNKYIRGILQTVSQRVFLGDPTKVFALVSGFRRGLLGDGAYGTISSGEYTLLLNPDGSYALPAQSTNTLVTEFPDVPIYATGLTRAIIEVTDGGVVEYVLDTSSTPSLISVSKGGFYPPKWLLTNGYSGNIRLYIGFDTNTLEIKYDLKTGLRWVSGLPPLWLTPPLRTTNGTELSITGRIGGRVIIECSDDFRVWIPASVLDNPTGTATFIDKAVIPKSFYRARYE